MAATPLLAPAPVAPAPQPQAFVPLSKLASIAAPHLSVVIVNYRQWHSTWQLVRQVLAEPWTPPGRVEAVVVDNHSPAPAFLGRLRRWPGLSLRRWRRNRGFARAANEGCRLSSGDWLLLLNPDVSLPDNFLPDLLALLERLGSTNPQAGVVGFQLRDSDGSPQWSAGPWPTLVSTLLGLLLPRSQRKCRPHTARLPRRVPWVTGCCLLLRRDCWKQLGGFDEDFFLYYEDVDLCRRARALGWQVWLEPRLHVVHHLPLHVRKVSARLRLCTRHGLLTYSAKHWPAWQAQALTHVIRLEAWLRQQWAKWSGDRSALRLFELLGQLAGDFAEARRDRARRRLERAIRGL